jgi:hypothetical protein
MSTRTYYRGPDAVVTDRLFVWHTTPAKGFVVRDLRKVALGRTETDRLRAFTPHVAGGAAIAAAATWMLVHTPVALAVSAATVSVPAAFALAAHLVRVTRWELRASYHGREVLLYASTDERVFNQVARALRRAVEDARSPSVHPLSTSAA